MAYTTECPLCGGRNTGRYICWKCQGTGEVPRYRKLPSQWDAQQAGWGPIFSWPQYGVAGHCQCCGKPLTGRRKTRCGDRMCDRLIWRRLYESIHWMKRHIIVRDGPVCAGCGIVFESPLVTGGPIYPEPRQLELDHIVPLIDGGTDLPDNLQLLCPPCHAQKTAHECRERPYLRNANVLPDAPWR
jgi:5-methylcytosine-specific restriction endonuclease McrA